jgi:hypothetical protein
MQEVFDILYADEYKKVLPKRLRQEKYQTLDEDKQEKVNQILSSY